MGLLKHLLFWPVTGPKFLIDFSLEKVQGVVKEQLTDDSEVKSELLELQLLFELGDIDDEEYAAREAALMHRLREIREWRERYGMGVAGGLVRVAGSEAGSEADSSPTPPPDAAPEGPQVARPDQASIDVHFDWE